MARTLPVNVPFRLQTDASLKKPKRSIDSPMAVKPWLRWVVYPSASIKLLLVPAMLSISWNPLWSYFEQTTPQNPFTPLFLLSHLVSGSTLTESRYEKGYGDLAFIAYHIVFFCFLRQIIVDAFHHIGRTFGIRKDAKLERFGEQGYATVYFAVMGAWGLRVMSQISTRGYQTESLWTDYPHSAMTPELKRYSLMQLSYWAQQLFVLILRLERPRKDYYELIGHHIVANWLACWIYYLNFTPLSNAICISTDIPDTLLAISKLLNYIHYEKTKVVSFAVFVAVWTYCRHVLEFHLLKSIWFEFQLMPDASKRWSGLDGVYMPSWMRYQIFGPLFLLQLLNLYWYRLILRILFRSLTTAKIGDERSEDEGDDEEEHRKTN